MGVIDNWKGHEREVARHFGTTRRVRGADFGKSDVEVLVSVDDWLGWEQSKVAIVIECKYSRSHTIIDYIKEQDPGTRPLIARIGSFILCWLDDFEDIFTTIFTAETTDFLELSNRYNLVTFDKKEPNYLERYTEQSRSYIASVQFPIVLPIVCLSKANTKGKLVVIKDSDLSLFNETLNQSINAPNTDSHDSTASD